MMLVRACGFGGGGGGGGGGAVAARWQMLELP